MKNKTLLFIKGLLSGMALITPGMSAGTIALITGIYSPIIYFLSSLQKVRTEFSKTLKSFLLLVPVFVGFFLGLLISIEWLKAFIQSHPDLSYLFFSGIILSSVPFLIQRTPINSSSILILIASTLFSFSLSFFNPTNPMGLWWFFLSVFLASLAMLLPGISGSYVLVLMGEYSEFLEAISSISLKFVGVAFTFILSFLSCSKAIQHLLKNYHTNTMACLTGFTLGGGMGIFPLKSLEKIQQASLNSWIILFTGAFIVFVVQYISSKYLSDEK